MDRDKDITIRQREAFKKFMQEHKLKAFPWAKKAGIAESTIRNYLNGLNQSLTSLVLDKLANTMGCCIGDLIGEHKPNINSQKINNSSLSRERLIQSFIKSEELIKKSNITISSEERINILLAWYDLTGIIEQEKPNDQPNISEIRAINKASR